MDKKRHKLRAEGAFVSSSLPHKHIHLSCFICWLYKLLMVNKQISTEYPPYKMKLISLGFIIQVQRTVTIMTAVVVSWEKRERVTSFIHNTTSCGCTAFWSIFWYCQWRDWYLVLFYDRFLPVTVDAKWWVFDSDVLTVDSDVYHSYFRLLDIYLLSYNAVVVLQIWSDIMLFCPCLAK